MPGSALPTRRCPPDKVRPVATSSRASSPALSMIPRGPPTVAVTSPYQSPPQQQHQQQQQQQQNKNNMIDKMKLFKSGETRPVSNTGKRTSSSSGVSSARSERSDSSISLEHNTDSKPIKNNNVRLKQQRPTKNVPNINKKETITSNKTKNTTAQQHQQQQQHEEKHSSRVANVPSQKVTGLRTPIKTDNVPPPKLQTPNNTTGIPKPTAAVKGTTKQQTKEIKSPPVISRESSNVNISKATVALISPMKNDNKDKENPLSESSHSASTGHHSNSSESSVIYKPSSESGSECQNIIPNRKEIIGYLNDIGDRPPIPIPEDEKFNNVILIKENHLMDNNLHREQQVEEESMNVEPMMPLLRGYCSTLTLPCRTGRQYQRVQPDGNADYCEISIANGYLSDGEMLRNPPREICDGYMSEGGSILYSRRLQTIPSHLTNG